MTKTVALYLTQGELDELVNAMQQHSNHLKSKERRWINKHKKSSSGVYIGKRRLFLKSAGRKIGYAKLQLEGTEITPAERFGS